MADKEENHKLHELMDRLSEIMEFDVDKPPEDKTKHIRHMAQIIRQNGLRLYRGRKLAQNRVINGHRIIAEDDV